MPEESSFELDPSQLGGADYAPGEMIQLKVVGKSSEGMLQVQCVHPDKKEMSWDEDFDKSMSPDDQEPAMAATDGGGAEQAS